MYALGCTFFHLLTGVPPYDGATSFVVVASHMSSKIPSVRERAPSVSPRVAAIVERLMAKTPAERFDDYDALLRELEGAAPERVRHAGFWVRGAANFLDCLSLGALVATLGWPGVFVHLAYITIGHGFFGATLPKYLLAIRVQRPDGRAIGLLRSMLRTFAALWLQFSIGALTFFTKGPMALAHELRQLQPTESTQFKMFIFAIAVSHGLLSILYAAGLVLAAFHPRRRALHDVLVDSDVVYRIREATVLTHVKSATKRLSTMAKTPRP
jgi:uncharacterized RDD family membrane protein YckC